MKKILLGILAAGLFTACQHDEYLSADSQMNAGVVATASLDVDGSRTELSAAEGGYKVVWSANDALSVFSSETANAKFQLSRGAGETMADFSFVSGELNFGIGETNEFGYVGLFPYSETATVVKNGADFVVNTEIPARQIYATGSFGQNASPMVAVNAASLKFSFKHVGSFLIMPLKGAGEKILYATLESKAHNIAGAVVATAEANNNWIPAVELGENVVNKIELACGDEGVILGEEATKFVFVLAPGTYEANDLVVKFYDSYGNYFETEITAENTFTRAKSRTFGARTFEVSGMEELDLYVHAEAEAYMQAERIVPSVTNLNVEAWVKNLYEKENTRGLIEQAITYITLGNYKAAYEVLEGVPGFKKETTTFTAKGENLLKVEYTGESYLTSMLKEVENINDIASLVKFMNDFENLYEASGLKNELNTTLENSKAQIASMIEEWAKGYNADINTEEAFATYKAEVKEAVQNARNSVSDFKGFVDGVRALGRSFLSTTEYNSLTDFIAAADALLETYDSLNTVDEIDAAVKNLGKVTIDASISKPSIGASYAEKLIKALAEVVDGMTYNNWKVTYAANPAEVLQGAKDDYNAAIGGLLDTYKDELIAGINTAIDNIIASEEGFVGALEDAVENPETTTAQFLTYLFEQESFMTMVKDTLRKTVEEIEAASREEITGENADAKRAAILQTKTNALMNARVEAVEAIKNEFAALNETNLSNLQEGPWGIFKKVLAWEQCIKLFDELGILDVYNTLLDLCAIYEQMIVFEKGSIYYTIENMNDYQENIDWWVITPNQDFE